MLWIVRVVRNLEHLVVLQLILKRHIIRSFSEPRSLFWRGRQLRFISNWLSMRGRIAMIVLIVHCFSHLLLQNSLLNSISMLYGCGGWLCKIFGNHRHLSTISIHFTWLKLIFEVFLVPSRWIRCEHIRFVDLVVSTTILMLFRVHCEQGVFACVSCSLLFMRGRTVRMGRRFWILQCRWRILDHLRRQYWIISLFGFLSSRLTLVLGDTWVSLWYLFGGLLVLGFLQSLKVADWRGNSISIDNKRRFFTAENHFFASSMWLKILCIHLHISAHYVNWVWWSTWPQFN